MSEQEEVLQALEEAGVVDLFEWVGQTASWRLLQDFDEDAGHDQAVIGTLGYKYLINLFDRASGSGRFALPEGAAAEDGLDLVRAGVTQEAFEAMPRFEPGSIFRSNFNGSPGWAQDGIRWLLQSYRFGKIDKIAWTKKSDTKRRVAQYPFFQDSDALLTYADFGLDEEDFPSDLGFEGKTLVLAHSFDRATGAYEIYLGRSRDSGGRGENPWYWRYLVASGGSDGGLRETGDALPVLPGTPASAQAEDLKVRLRAKPGTKSTTQN